MKQILISAAVAAIVSGAVVFGLDRTRGAEAPTAPATSVPATSVPAGARPPTLRYTDPLPEDVWINGSATAGTDHRSLTSAENSVCFLTKVELSGIGSPKDKSSCSLQVDSFTGFWDLAATVEEGGQSSVRCNARCLIWE
jgi:hypothetical protein